MAWWLDVLQLAQGFGLATVAGIGVVIGTLRVVAANRQATAALHQAELARRDHVAELFNRAVGQLDAPKLQVRLGAVHTRRPIAIGVPDLTRAVLDLPSVDLREGAGGYGNSEPPSDVRAITDLLRTLSRKERP
jgi:hypothetical protein